MTEIKGSISHHQWGIVYGGGGTAPTLQGRDYKSPVLVMMDNNERLEIQGKDSIVIAHEGDGVVTSRPQSVRMLKTDQVSMAIAATARTDVVVSGIPLKEGVVVDDAAILTPQRTEYASEKDGIAENNNGKLRIRYLTPRECLRLQAFPEDAIDKLQSVLSKSAMYKVAGNSIAVCCLKAIFKGIYVDKTFKKTGRQVSLNRWL